MTRAVESTRTRNYFFRSVIFLVILDVKNTFNSVRWTDIYPSMEMFKVPEYIPVYDAELAEKRMLLYEMEDEPCIIEVPAGVVQGSIFGPDI